MHKKLLVISAIVIMLLLTTTTGFVASKSNDAGILNRTHIRAIGTFHICEDDGNLYGHIIIGFKNFKPVLNSDIEINKDSITWIVLSGFSSNSETAIYIFVNCVFEE